ncbi:hypothetical protein AYK25_06360 [Thermoplasmatales archaeon SM1-50]|nr:MAG: hypothetical protein AYK25_06360 [Thermoplasmatales archaeon SM1-50]
MLKKIRFTQAVSEVIGVVVLLGITISLFGVLHFFVFSLPYDASVPPVTLIGTIDKVNKTINIQHNGGVSLEGNISVTITIGSLVYQNTMDELLLDLNGDNKWNFGETVQFHFTGIDITDKYVKATVVDPIANTILVSIILQKGLNE